jgi:cytochrome c551
VNGRIREPFKSVLSIGIPAVLISLIATGCAQSSGGGPEGPADVVALYQKNNCVSCHGSELQGRMGEATNLQKVGARMTKEQIVKQIRDGSSGMPPFGSQLSPEEIDKLAEWLAGKK